MERAPQPQPQRQPVHRTHHRPVHPAVEAAAAAAAEVQLLTPEDPAAYAPAQQVEVLPDSVAPTTGAPAGAAEHVTASTTVPAEAPAPLLPFPKEVFAAPKQAAKHTPRQVSVADAHLTERIAPKTGAPAGAAKAPLEELRSTEPVATTTEAPAVDTDQALLDKFDRLSDAELMKLSPDELAAMEAATARRARESRAATSDILDHPEKQGVAKAEAAQDDRRAAEKKARDEAEDDKIRAEAFDAAYRADLEKNGQGDPDITRNFKEADDRRTAAAREAAERAVQANRNGRETFEKTFKDMRELLVKAGVKEEDASAYALELAKAFEAAARSAVDPSQASAPRAERGLLGGVQHARTGVEHSPAPPMPLARKEREGHVYDGRPRTQTGGQGAGNGGRGGNGGNNGGNRGGNGNFNGNDEPTQELFPPITEGQVLDSMDGMFERFPKDSQEYIAAIAARLNKSRLAFTDAAARRGRSTFSWRFRNSKVAEAHENYVQDQILLNNALSQEFADLGVTPEYIKKYVERMQMNNAISIVGEWTDHKIELSGGTKENGERTMVGKFLDRWASWGGNPRQVDTRGGVRGFLGNLKNGVKANFGSGRAIWGNAKKIGVVGAPLAVVGAVAAPFVAAPLAGVVGAGLGIAAGLRVARGLFSAKIESAAQARTVASAQGERVEAEVQQRILDLITARNSGVAVSGEDFLRMSTDLILGHANLSVRRNRLRTAAVGAISLGSVVGGEVVGHALGFHVGGGRPGASEGGGSIKPEIKAPGGIETTPKPNVVIDPSKYTGHRTTWAYAHADFGGTDAATGNSNATEALDRMIAGVQKAGGHVTTHGAHDGTHWIIDDVTTPDGKHFTSAAGKYAALKAYDGYVAPTPAGNVAVQGLGSGLAQAVRDVARGAASVPTPRG